MSYESLKLLSAGVVTSVGYNLSATAAAIRAGVDNFQETDFIDEEGEPIIGARIFKDRQEQGLVAAGNQQQLHWVKLALCECFGNINAQHSDYIRIIPLLAEASRPSVNQQQALLEGIQLFAENLLEDRLESVQAPICTGNISCIHGLQAAESYLQQHPKGAVCLLAIDSWLNINSIRYALDEDRLLSASKADGLIPGEAIAAVLLASETPTSTHLEIQGKGLAEEQAILPSEKPCFGHGLAKAIKQALQQANLPAYGMHMRLNDINGEEYYFNETAYAWSRVLRKPMPKVYQYQQPATRVGDVGAAFGPLLLAYNLHLARIQRHPGQHTLIHLSSTEAQRGAMVTTAHYQKD